MTAWYQTGDEGAQRSEQDDQRRQKQNSGPRRFWMKADPQKSTQIVFLDTDGFFFREHQMYIGGSWQNWVTCIEGISAGEECPICEDGKYRYGNVAAYSIIDLTQFTTKRDNRLVTASKRLLVTKAAARRKIVKQKERRDNDLTFCKFEVTRFTDKECSTGEDFEFIERLTIEQVKELLPLDNRIQPGQPEEGHRMTPEAWVAPYDYPEVFAPKSADELRNMIGMPAPVGSPNSGPPAGSKDLGSLV